MRPKLILLVTVAAILSFFCLGGRAEIRQLISHQGKVTDAGGTPVADRTYDMRFRIFNAATGPALQWSSDIQPVDVTSGVFHVLLGEGPQPTLSLEFDQDY